MDWNYMKNKKLETVANLSVYHFIKKAVRHSIDQIQWSHSDRLVCQYVYVFVRDSVYSSISRSVKRRIESSLEFRK
jgi:hypothetical protein